MTVAACTQELMGLGTRPVLLSFVMTTNKIFTGLGKSFGGKIVWLGGATAGIAAALSAIGFLAIRAHHELLGITSLVPVPTDSWTIEGARVVYNTLLLLFFGIFNLVEPLHRAPALWMLGTILVIIMLFAVAMSETWLDRIRKVTRFSVVRGLIIVATLVGLGLNIAFILQDQTDHLLVSPPSPAIDRAIQLRITADGMTMLKLEYAVFVTILIFFLVWLKLLPHFFGNSPANADAADASGLSIWQGMAWFLMIVQALLLPMSYGRMVMANGYFKVCLLPETEKSGTSAGSCTGHQGWLLHRDKEDIVIYQPNPSNPVQVFKQSEFKQIQVLTFDNVFTSIPATPQNLLHPSFGQTMKNLGAFLRTVPQTLASGLVTTRSLHMLQTLVLANSEGQTSDVFSPFTGEERRWLQSPLWLPDQRILYVEVENNVATLKVVAVSEGKSFTGGAELFGASPLEGWEPFLTPDGQQVIFRQGAMIMQADLTGTEVIALLTDMPVERILGMLPEEEHAGYYLLFEVQGMPDQIAHIRDNTVISTTPVEDDYLTLLPHLRMHETRVLSEKRDKVQEGAVWNIYMSDSPAQEGRQLTNTNPAAKPLNSRYPAWNPDGSGIVYASE